MPSTSNFDLTYNQQNVVAGGALSNPAATTGVTGGGVDQILAGTNVSISPTSGVGIVTISASGGGTGTVTNVASGTGLTGGPITTTGTLSIANTGVSASTYGDSTHVPQIAVNAQGQITSASSTAISFPTAPVTSVSGSGSGISVSPTTGSVVVSNTGVTSIVAGSNITISPSGGTGAVTINSTAGGTGTVTSVATGTGLTGGPITTSGTISLASAYAGNGIGTVNGIAKGNGSGTITAATAGTDYVIPSGSITGTSGNVTGTVAIGNGGTGATTASGARTNLGLGTVATQTAPSGTSSQLLANNGTGGFNNVTVGSGLTYSGGTLSSSAGGGTVTSVGTSGSVNGITLSGGPITTSGTITLGGTLGSIANSQLSNSSVTVTAGTGLSGGGSVSLGGSTTLTNAGVTSLTAGTGISLSGSTGSVTITNTGGFPSGSQGQALLYGSSGGAFLNTAINVLTYGTSFSSISSAVSAAQTAGTSLYFPQGSYTISSNLTASCPVIIDGTITINSGVTLTLNGTVTAPLKQVFTVNGTLNIGNTTPNIYPEWFGAKQGSVSDYVAINNALAAVTIDSTSSSMVSQVVLSGNYNIAGQITVTSGKVFKCVWGAQFTASGGYTGDCIVYQHNGQSVVSEIPTIKGFNTGAGLTLLGCSVMDFKCFEINNCKYAVKIKAAIGYPVLDNIIRVQFIADCQYGFYFTSDGTGQTMQGNEMYCNFYTNNNNYSNPWVKTSGGTGTQYTGVSTIGLIAGRYTTITNLGSLTQAQWNTIAGTTGLTYSVGTNFIPAGNLAYDPTITTLGTVTQYAANGIAAGYFDSTNSGAWDGNNLEILAIDLNGATNSYGYYNAASNPINGWLIRCDNWFGGIGGNTGLWANGATYNPGNTARDPSTGNVYALKDSSPYTSTIQPSSDPSHWLAAGTYTSNIFSTSFITGYFQACTLKFLMRGDLTQPQWGYGWGLYGGYNRIEFRNGGAGSSSPNGQPTLQTSSGNRSTFNPTPIFQNRVVCSYTFPFDFGTNSVATFYAYSVAADGYSGGASNCLNAINLTSLGITIDAIYDNGAVNQNEIVIKARNVSGSVIPTGTQWCMMLVAGV